MARRKRKSSAGSCADSKQASAISSDVPTVASDSPDSADDQPRVPIVEIGRIARQPYVRHVPLSKTGELEEWQEIANILRILHDSTGVDFHQYKANTIYRRIMRRAVLRKTDGLKGYGQFLRDNPEEADALYRDILISVTSFFRNPESLEALKTKVFPKLCQKRSPQETLRIWAVGCSTGEEAYSLAMIYAEFAAESDNQVPVQVFATDLNEASIEKAREAVYSKNIAGDVSPERLRRFFVEADGHYRVCKSIREMCIFAQHNALTDPFFSRIDLISCRNLLIYLEPPLQDKLLTLLHYALKPVGFLFLGGSETIGSHRTLFEAEDAKHKLFFKKPGPARPAFRLPVDQSSASSAELHRRTIPLHQANRATDVQRAADRILVSKYAPPGVIINADLEILQFRGETGPYLAPSSGKASLNLYKMCREGLLVPLRAALQKSKRDEAPVHKEGLRVKSNGGYRDVNLEVIPVGENEGQGNCFLVLFDEVAGRGARLPKQATVKPTRARPNRKGESSARQVVRLTEELAATRDYLQSVIEQHEVDNEELQSANEEVQSNNKELQSINEELETSKEELQSSNEELSIVNDELQNRNQELSRLSNDQLNLIYSVQLPIVMVGQDLCIRRYTPLAKKLLNLIPADIGRPIGDLKLRFAIPDLEKLLAEVKDTVSDKEFEIQDEQGRWFSLRLRPYKTLENKIDGAVIVLVDIDAIKRAQAFAENIINKVNEPLLILDSNLRVLTANLAFCQAFQVTPQETENCLLYELGNGQWNIPDLRRLLVQVLPQNTVVHDFVVKHRFEHLGQRTMLLNARQLIQSSDPSPTILLAIQDITKREQLEEDLRDRAEELAAADRRKNQFLAMLAHELRNPLAALQNGAQILKSPGASHDALTQARDIIEWQIQNMARMIEDLLDFHQIERGTIQLRKETVVLAEVLKHAADSCRPHIESRGQELVITLTPETVYLDADPTRLEQVFGNLLENASKFSNPGGHIWLTAEMTANADQPADEVLIHVRDDGMGIAAEVLPHIFDLFVQAEHSLDRQQGGLGIGLTLVHDLVRLHGGSLAAQSAGLGRGSEFIVRLPIKKLTNVELLSTDKSAGGISAPSKPTPVVPARHRILVVDDSTAGADSLSIVLGLSGHTVQVAYDGPTALEAAESFRPEVVLIDIGMPIMDGYELAKRLRQRFGNQVSMLMIAMSGYGQDEYRLRSQEAGFDAHLVKPIEYSALQELLARLSTRAG